jgi:nucleotide-binding universal stress UspA family protein
MEKKQASISGNILLAVDGSQSAKVAARIAVQVASAMHWGLHALYVVDVTDVFDIYTDTAKELSELEEELPSEQKVRLFEEQGALALTEIEGICQGTGVPFTQEISFGGVPEVVLKTSKDYNLLAIGRRGNRHKKEVQHLGSNFQQIAHHSHIPLLISGDDSVVQKLQHGLLAYDGSELSRKALDWAETLHNMLTSMTVLSVEKEDEKDHTWLADRHEEIASSNLTHCEFIRAEGDPGSIIASTGSEKQADLILMGAYQHTRFLGWARHSVIDIVLRGTDLPVLATK